MIEIIYDIMLDDKKKVKFVGGVGSRQQQFLLC